jgi:hypothetical protein
LLAFSVIVIAAVPSAATLREPSFRQRPFRFPDPHPTQGQRTPANGANKVTEVMEQMGSNCFSLNGLGGISDGRIKPETDGLNPTISGQIRVNFRRLAERKRKRETEQRPLPERCVRSAECF